ncbi:MAG: nickel-dependent lactate racemase [Anaerolineae bacterium]|nr:nickel-dependent lactate racemase [Anaerolineae bacterium]
MRIKLAYGREGMWVDLPKRADIDVIEPQYVEGLADEPAALRAALAAPMGTRPLSELVREADLSTCREPVAVVFSDITRPMPNDRVLPVLLAELEAAGVSPERITLINALGTHRPQTEEELAGMLGAEIVKRYPIVQHDAWDDANLVGVARNRNGRLVRVHRAYAEAVVRILTGFVEPHFFAGASGGPKAVLPGIADIDSIMDNHGARLLASGMATWAVTTGNPLWDELCEATQATQPTFVLNVTLNRDRQLTGVFAGEMLRVHQAAVAFVRARAMRPVVAPYDIVVTTNSGYPLDLNLYQAVKGMSAAAQIVKPGGDIIIAAECWDGIPDHGEYGRLLREASSPEALLATIMTPGFRCHDQWEAQIQAQIQLKARVHVYADGLSDDQLRAAMVRPCRSIEGRLQELLAQNPGARIAVLPEGPQTVPYLD